MEKLSKVMIVDDDDEIVRSVRLFFRSDPIELLEAEDGPEALRKLNESVDLVILDLNLPGMSGVDTLKKVRELSPETVVVILSGDDSPESVVTCMKLGAMDYIAKPFDVTKFKIMVKNALRTRTLEREVQHLKTLTRQKSGTTFVLGHSPSMDKVLKVVEKVAPFNISVLITGESGVGKEVIMHSLHNLSPWKDQPCIAVDCTALPEHLAESELFGYEKGAFTGADQRKLGRIEMANGGTLFLDEIGDLPLLMQSKLLRVLQEKKFSRLGSKDWINVDFRLISATNIDLKARAASGEFRLDLYHRLNELNIEVPPLRQRREDIMLLAEYFLRDFCIDFRREISGFSEDAQNCLRSYAWPGNVRELRNVVKRAVIFAKQVIETVDLPEELRQARAEELSNPAAPAEGHLGLKQALDLEAGRIEAEMIRKVLTEAGGNKSETARQLKVDYKTLLTKIKKYHLE